MGKRRYLGGSTVIGPGSGWFAKPPTWEEHLRQLAHDRTVAEQERFRVAKEQGKQELAELLERQVIELERLKAASSPEGIAKRHLKKAEKAIRRQEAKSPSKRISKAYANLEAEIDALFLKNE